MNQKVKVLGCASIREKIVRYLFERKMPTERSVEIWCVKRWQNI